MLQLSKQLLKGDKRSLSRAISMLEKDVPEGLEVMRDVYPHTGKAYTIGVTGPPGAGKSTLITRMTEKFRSGGTSVGIIAVDPSSPFSGGALLGDRIRMEPHYLDPGVFIRSMATRGTHGGVPKIIKGVVRLLDASGKNIVLVETVGVGQTELDIMGVADTVVVTLVPEAGDTIQTLKAGLMEIADVYVVNKSDRPGAQRMVSHIQAFLTIGASSNDWTPEVIAAEAVNGVGIQELAESIWRHRDFLTQSSELEERRRERRSLELLEVVRDRLELRLKQYISDTPALEQLLEQVRRGDVEPYTAAIELLEQMSFPMDRFPNSSS